MIGIGRKTRLKRSKKIVEQGLLERIKKGEEIINNNALTSKELRFEKSRWEDYNKLFIEKLLYKPCYHYSIGVITPKN